MSHVQNIKKRFEQLNLNSEVDSLVDFLPLRDKQDTCKSPFQRSVTLIEFNSSKYKENKDIPGKNQDDTVNFQRQHSSNSSSSYKSVRRSQAFRLDVERKPQLTKNPPIASKLKRQNAVKYTSPSKKPEFDELQYLAKSETIKKALEKPLPTGPAPKKPPRTFTESPKTSPINESTNLIHEFQKAIDFNNQSSAQIKLNNDIGGRRTTTLPKTTEKKGDKSDNKKGISSFLNCIISPCSIDPIYYDQVSREQQYKLNCEEKIYMEPYEHLHYKKNLQDSNTKTELHYLCTNIIDQTNYSNDINRSFLDNNKESSDLESYEKINILMDVVYDEKHRDNIMDESSGSSEMDIKSPIVKVTRSLTEKRKNYVRRVTESVITKDTTNFGSKHQLQSAASIINQFQRIIDSNDGPQMSPPRKINNNKLFETCLLIGYDMMNKKGYIKSIYPKNEKVLPMFEQFVYPSTNYSMDLMTKENQNFTLILTDEYGNNLFGYCRQIIAEGFEEKCLPLTYCLITKVNASGFYFNLLKEIESRHGYPEVKFTYMLRSLQNQELPKSGKILHIKLFDSSANMRNFPEIAKKPDREVIQKSSHKYATKRLSLESPEWLKSEALNLLQQNKSHETTGISRSQTESIKRSDEIIIKRSNDVRLENDELTVLYESTTKELLIIIFGTLLIERKVILLGKNISQITACVTALYSILYPFQWHHTIIATIPDKIIELLQAPFPFFAGVLKNSVNIENLEIEDGILVDLETKTLIKKCGDEATLVPETLKKSLFLSLKIVEAIDKGKKLKNVLIAEAFLQYFVKLFAKLDASTYSKNKFIESHDDQAIKYFLEWFLDTIMFKEFLSKRINEKSQREKLVSISSENYFELFNIKILEKSATLSDNQQRKNVEILIKSTKQKKKNFKDKIKDFLKS